MSKKKNKDKEINIPIKIFNNKSEKSKNKINHYFLQSYRNSENKEIDLSNKHLYNSNKALNKNKKNYFFKSFDNYSKKKKYFIMYSGITLVMFLIFVSWIIFLKHNFQNNSIISQEGDNLKQLESKLDINFLKIKQKLQQVNEQINKFKALNSLSDNLPKLTKGKNQLYKAQEVDLLIKNIKNRIEEKQKK